MNRLPTSTLPPTRWIDRGPNGWVATPADGPYDPPTAEALRTCLDDESWRTGWE